MHNNLTGCGKTISAQQNFDSPHVWDNWRTLPQDAQNGGLLTRQPRRLLHPSALSLPRQPLHPGTRLVPGKAAAPQLTLVSRLTFHASLERRENAADGFFQHPAMWVQVSPAHLGIFGLLQMTAGSGCMDIKWSRRYRNMGSRFRCLSQASDSWRHSSAQGLEACTNMAARPLRLLSPSPHYS